MEASARICARERGSAVRGAIRSDGNDRARIRRAVAADLRRAVEVFACVSTPLVVTIRAVNRSDVQYRGGGCASDESPSHPDERLDDTSSHQQLFRERGTRQAAVRYPVRAVKALVRREVALVAGDQCGEHPRCESELRAPVHWKGEDRSHVEGNAKPLVIRLIERPRRGKLNGIDGVLPPGDSRVVTDEELIGCLSFPVYRRVATGDLRAGGITSCFLR